MKSSIYQTKLRGKTVWVVSRTDPAGKVRRSYFPNEKLAKAHSGDIELQIAKAGEAWVALPGYLRAELIQVADEVRAAGLSLREVWDAHRKRDCIADSISLGDAVRQCVDSKRAMGRRPAYVEMLDYTLSRFATGRESAAVATITTVDCEQWLTASCKALASRASFQARLSSLFAWCVQQGYCQRNPCDRLGKVSLEQKAPVILTPSQVDAALAWVELNQDFKAYFVLGLFCGIRPDELGRLTWESVDMIRGLVTIDASTSKVRRRRIVPIAARAAQILSSNAGSTGPIWPGSPATLRRRRRELARHLGFTEWPSDLLRHTAASYMMARDKDAGRVANALGNSPGVLLTRYTELVGPEAAEAFWGNPKPAV